MTKEQIKKTLDILEKYGFVYQGYNRLDYCDLFIKKSDWEIERVEINPNGISFEGLRTDRANSNSTHVILYGGILDEFKKIFDYIVETRSSLPKEYAKNQRDLDRAYKWQMGIDTYCEVE